MKQVATRNIEFSIDDCQSLEQRIYVLGRCLEDTIRVGDTFSSMFRPQINRDGGVISSSPDESSRVSINFRTVKIEAYKSSLEELSSGTTARIEISGDGVEHLQKGLVLSGRVAL